MTQCWLTRSDIRAALKTVSWLELRNIIGFFRQQPYGMACLIRWHRWICPEVGESGIILPAEALKLALAERERRRNGNAKKH